MPRRPDFLIIGATKSGTTSLFHYCCQHPRIAPPRKKELHYYDRHRFGDWSPGDYRACFPDRPADCLSGEATPNYLFHAHIPELVAEDFPDVKLIAILRDPGGRHLILDVRPNADTMALIDGAEISLGIDDSETFSRLWPRETMR